VQRHGSGWRRVFNRNRRRGPAPWGELPPDAAVEPEELPAPDDLAALLTERPGVVLEQLDQLVAGALGELSAAERAVLLLRAVGELSYREIHDVLSIPLGSVMGYLSRARLKMRRSLAGYAAERGVLRRPVTGETRP
jgi:DNA-directed RNA polymerase specialized sigma24 family protein